MGRRYQFSCGGCGYTAEVSGGDDAGMAVVTTTIVCEACRELYDVVSAEIEDIENPKELALRCPKSPTHEVKCWETGGACPKCGVAMVKGPMVCLWD